MEWVLTSIIPVVLVILLAISYAVGQDKEKRRNEAQERERRARKKREDTENNRGARIKNALEQHNKNLKGKFDITGAWNEYSGYEINVYRFGVDSRKVPPMLIHVDSRRGMSAVRIWRTAPSPQEFPLDDSSIKQVIVEARNHMDVMSI